LIAAAVISSSVLVSSCFLFFKRSNPNSLTMKYSNFFMRFFQKKVKINQTVNLVFSIFLHDDDIFVLSRMFGEWLNLKKAIEFINRFGDRIFKEINFSREFISFPWGIELNFAETNPAFFFPNPGRNYIKYFQFPCLSIITLVSIPSRQIRSWRICSKRTWRSALLSLFWNGWNFASRTRFSSYDQRQHTSKRGFYRHFAWC